jgi:hypothetical protein
MRPGWIIVFMLFLVQMVNFADKSVLGISAHAIMQELRLTPQQYGFVESSFYSLYAITGIAIALAIAPRIRPRQIITVLLTV